MLAGATGVALAVGGALATGRDEVYLGLTALAATAAVVYVALRVEPAWPISAGIAVSIFRATPKGSVSRLGPTGH